MEEPDSLIAKTDIGIKCIHIWMYYYPNKVQTNLSSF